MFELLKTDTHTKARLGRLTTAHGVIETPVFMAVGTQASVKAIDPHNPNSDDHGIRLRVAPACEVFHK